MIAAVAGLGVAISGGIGGSSSGSVTPANDGTGIQCLVIQQLNLKVLTTQ